jgi:hypothetical protein
MPRHHSRGIADVGRCNFPKSAAQVSRASQYRHHPEEIGYLFVAIMFQRLS